MKRQLLRLSIVLVIANILGTGAHAQFPPGAYRPNPLTGGAVPQVPYNPLTGAGAALAQANPLIGAVPQPGPAFNPYTGRPMAKPAAVNSLTGKLQELGAVETPTAAQVYQWPKGKFPVTGKAGPGLEPLDDVVQTL